MAKQSKHMTLREAAAISGYSQDYLGQLIRKGKLEGTQIYSHVSWVTTEDALQRYIDANSRKTKGAESTERSENRSLLTKIRNTQLSVKLLKVALVLTNISVVCLLVFGFFVLSAAIDDRMDKQAMEKAMLVSIKGPP